MRRSTYVACDVYPARGLKTAAPPAAAKLVRKFVKGPKLFRSSNLLSVVPPRELDEVADHHMLGLLVASRGSFTGAHVDWYGCDAFMQLLEGEKLWYLAPPEKETEFRRLLQGGLDGAPSKAVQATCRSTKDREAFLLHSVQAVHQQAGDIIYVPGGWVHAVKNLTDTVSFGNSYLRGWKLATALMEWAKEHKPGSPQLDKGVSPVNFEGIRDLIVDDARADLLDVSAIERADIICKWRAQPVLQAAFPVPPPRPPAPNAVAQPSAAGAKRKPVEAAGTDRSLRVRRA